MATHVTRINLADGTTADVGDINPDLNQAFDAINDHADDIEAIQDRLDILEAVDPLTFGLKYRLVVTWASVSTVDVDATTLSLRNAAGTWVVVNNVNVTANMGLVGANGLETGLVEAANTWYSIWVIYNGATIASLISDQTAVPTTLPAGYTYYRRVGWVRNGAAQNFAAFYHDYDSDFFMYDTEDYGAFDVSPWALVEDVSLAAEVPPTCRRARLNVRLRRKNTAADIENWVNLRPAGSATGYVTAAFSTDPVANQYVTGSDTIDLNLDSSQAFDHLVQVSANETGQMDIYVVGYYDPI